MYFSYCSHHHCQPQAGALALSIQGVSAIYPDTKQVALRNISMSIKQGSCMAVVGANGAGKSTLFKVIAHLLPISHGQMHVFGHPLGACHQRIAYLPQRSEIDWAFPMTVRELVMTGCYVNLGWLKRPGQQEQRATFQALEQLNILDLAQRQINQLSGGQQQRVLIARSLVQGAELLLLDEPLNAVDKTTREIVAKVLDDLKQQGKTVMVATHFIDQEQSFYDGAIYLKDGELVQGDISDGHQHSANCQH